MKNKGTAGQGAQWLRLAATALLLYALAHLASAQLRLARTEELAESLAAEREALAASIAEMEHRLKDGESAAALEERARRELGLVRPGEIIFVFEDGQED